jgi:hypothetical protein
MAMPQIAPCGSWKSPITTDLIVSETIGLAQVFIDGQDIYRVEMRPSEGGRSVIVRRTADGSWLAWLTWNHPNMPWDSNALWIGEIPTDGSIRHAEHIAGGANESIFQPEWSPESILHFISDRTGWWNLYCRRNGDRLYLSGDHQLSQFQLAS